MKKVLLLLFMTISSLVQGQVPTDWQVEGLKGRVKKMHIIQEYYWMSASEDTLYNPLPIFVDKYFDESGYLLYEEYNVVGPSSGKIMWSKVLDLGGYEVNRKEVSKASRPFDPVIFKGKKEWSSTTTYRIVFKSETSKEHSIVIMGMCDDKGRLLQSEEMYYVDGVVEKNESKVMHLDYNDEEMSSIEQESNRTTFSIPIKKTDVQIVEKDKYGNPLKLMYNRENMGKAVTVFQYEYY